MHPVLQAPPTAHTRYVPYDYNNRSQVNAPRPLTTYFVLDLSTKSRTRERSPDYTYWYPSPKSSPNSNTNHDQCISSKCCPGNPISSETNIYSEMQLPSPSVKDTVKLSFTVCNLSSSSRSPIDPDKVSKTVPEEIAIVTTLRTPDHPDTDYKTTSPAALVNDIVKPVFTVSNPVSSPISSNAPDSDSRTTPEATCLVDIEKPAFTVSNLLISPRNSNIPDTVFKATPESTSVKNIVEPVLTVDNLLSSPSSSNGSDRVSKPTYEAPSQSGTASSLTTKNKVPRPFKTLAKDSVALSASAIEQLDASTFIIDNMGISPEETKQLMEESTKKYAEFREKMLLQLHNNTNNTNQNMRRVQNNGNRAQDLEYLEKRRKNNEAAKRSRDARRNKQDEIAIRATFLEQENIMLKYKVQTELEDLERLRKMELARHLQVSR